MGDADVNFPTSMEVMYGKGYPQEQLEETEYPEQALLVWVDGLELGKQSGSGDVQRNKHCLES